MRAATIQEIKQELAALKPAQVAELCLRLARFKKENKELLTYLLFEAHDEHAFTESLKEEITELFDSINKSHLYYAKKTLRKITRVINKYCRYSQSKQMEVGLRLHFCKQLQDSGIPVYNNAIAKIYEGQMKKLESVLDTLHEDLQYDYRRELERLNAR